MFQYALVEALRSRGREAGCNLGFYRLHPDSMPFILDKVFPKVYLNDVEDNIFKNIDNRWREIKNNEEMLKVFKKDLKKRFFYVEEDGKYDRNIFETENCTFVGYWQTEKYFLNIENKLKKIYTFENLESKLQDFGKYLSKNYVSVHIRRNDYLNHKMFSTCSKEYYIRAINYIKNQMTGMRFIFFSDDKEWVSENYKSKDMIVCDPGLFDNYQDWYDLYLMTVCRGNIIANSSFSWWGAWLNHNPDSIVIAPEKWFNGKKMPDIWCPKWVRM